MTGRRVAPSGAAIRLVFLAPAFALAFAFAVVLALALATGPARALERITDFDIRIEVEPNAALLVTETISVIAEGEEIRRGIYRDLPTVQTTALGLFDLVEYAFLDVERDGVPEPHFVVPEGEFTRLYIGDADTLIPDGPHTYRITYRIAGQIRFREDADELYWNLTGNGWAFPIERVTADIRLPAGAEVSDVSAYTGYFGEAGSDHEITEAAGDRVRLHGTRGFQVGEGITVSVSWQHGLLPAPATGDVLADRLADNPGALAAVLGFLLLAAYYLTVWWRFGRDPRKGVIIPLFEPPEGLSPAAVGHIHARGFEDGMAPARALTVAITSLAIKGMLTIEDHGKKSGSRFLLRRTEKEAKGLPAGEAALIRRLFDEEEPDDVVVGGKFDPTLAAAQSVFMDAVRKEYSDAYFTKHGGKWFLGVLLTVVASIGSAVWNAPGGEDPMILAGALTLFYGVMVGLFFWAAHHLWTVARSNVRAKRGRRLVLASLVTLVAAAPMALFGTGVALTASTPVAVSVFGMIAMVVVFFDLLDAPTVLGRAVMDKIDGYILFMTTTEWDRMQAIGEMPAPTVAMFEKHLPYSMALGVDDAWSRTFTEYAKAASMPVEEYESSWYRSRDRRPRNPSELSRGFSSRMVSVMSTASTRPSYSSSGSSGGGSSGGGGGGGGGGGW